MCPGKFLLIFSYFLVPLSNSLRVHPSSWLLHLHTATPPPLCRVVFPS